MSGTKVQNLLFGNWKEGGPGKKKLVYAHLSNKTSDAVLNGVDGNDMFVVVTRF